MINSAKPKKSLGLNSANRPASPKRSLGQNFLTSVGAVNKIVDTAVEAAKVVPPVGGPTLAVAPPTTILEIGPGRGVLTEALLKKFKKVLAVEKDDNLFVELGEKFAKEIETGQLKLIHGDILELSPEKLELSGSKKEGLMDLNVEREGNEACDKAVHAVQRGANVVSDKVIHQIHRTYGVVANIPYYITGQFLRTWLETEFPPKFMVLMLQKEVAQRIAARAPSGQARDGKESLLSISVKAYGEPKYIETIKRGSFYPIPNVDSAILLINNISKEFFSGLYSAVTFPAHSHQGGFATKITAEHNPGPLTDQATGECSGVAFIANPPLFPRAEKETPECSPRSVTDSEKAFFNILRAGFAHKRKFLIKNLEDTVKDKEKLQKAFEFCGISPKARAEDLKPKNWKCLAENLRGVTP